MKIDAQLLLDHVNKASVGGLIDAVVLGKHFSYAVTDDTKSVVSICKKGIVKDDTDPIGIYRISLFNMAVQYAKGIIFSKDKEIDMEITEDRLVFKKGEHAYSFKLSSPKAVRTTVGNPDEVIEKVSAGPASIIPFNAATRSMCLKTIQSVETEKCTFIVESGKVKLLVGRSEDHNVIVPLGDTKGKNKFKLVVKPDFLSKVLGVLPADKDATLELRDSVPLIIDIENYTFLVASMEIE
jgi:hypothetical protein